ncbi:DsrE family protein [Sulfurimonas sp. HSL-3221]|uniref:DsrE family protein n=1 Tax=Sulfurimonadaceae TaxID=2771471 RepID=UPI001E55867E|nr:DsrE family protein [Sulfurimonas sp. HSL-3221]UFS63274.1 DsrE family protein [Sulfurimonas sp. HSL-3221]
MRFLIILLAWGLWLNADTEFADPKPALDNPRQVVFSVTEGTDEAINHVLSSANNVLKFYGPEKVQMEIVAYSGGIRTLLKNNPKIAERVRTLMLYDVTFVACGNTMRTKNITEDQLIDDVEVVTAGIVEMIERVKEGWVYIKP